MKISAMLLVVGVVAGAASTCLAERVRMDHPGNAYRDPNFAGGAFRATTTAGYNGELGGFGGSNTSFLTFCLERNEHVVPGNTYYTTISTEARAGGVGGGSPDPLSATTALLYTQFRTAGNFGNLAGLGNGLLDTANEIRSLQRAIWRAEDEFNGTESEFLNDALAIALYNWAMANNDGTIGNVRVLNLWSDAGYTQHAQDQLTIIPLPPAAWAGLACLGGVFGVRYARRRSHCA